ncbi:MAG TPA: hypothetical protein EYQ66_05795 [Myxococcales bacterium]|nr:hypothetical protein [Myxococcales bacterium]
MTEDEHGSDDRSHEDPSKLRAWSLRALPWLITLVCFAYLYSKLSGAAGREGLTLFAYLGGVFANVHWGNWLLLMIPYSFFFFLIDTAVVWRVVNYFNTRVGYRDMLPIRGSSYILSILNEQVGKGAMGLYLNRRYGVPGWEVGSSMLFIMFCEFYYLLAWATVGWWIGRSSLPEVFGWIPWIALGASFVFLGWIMLFRSKAAKGVAFRERPVFKAFREASPLHYLSIVLIRSPALLSAVVVYTLALRLFGVEVGFVQMLGFLPVIFFGAATPGPMRTVAITLWVVLFPGNQEGEMAAFGLVQHNFFIFFNAAIGLIFLRRANRELFD